MRLAFRIALRFLSSNKGQTALIVLGIAIGISVQIFIGSLIEGLQASLLDSTIGRSSHITIEANKKNDPVLDYNEVIMKLNQNTSSSIDTKQIKVVSEVITRGAFLIKEDTTQQILVKAFNQVNAEELYQFDAAILEGSWPSENEILIGNVLAKELELSLGDKIEILTSQGTLHEVRISGIFDLKVAAINQSWSITTLDNARSIFSIPDNEVSAIELQINEPFTADEFAKTLAAEIEREDVKYTDWKSQNEQLLSGLSGQSTSSLMIQVFVVISVVLGIASVLAISVLQKSRQIGILKAMGVDNPMSSMIFLFQGFLLGILGGVFGILFGLGLLWSFTKFALNADGTPVVPILINPSFILLSGFIAIAASTIASIIPARKSMKLSPMEVIKNG